MPAFDRDSGSQDIDNAIRFLLDDGWSVTFLAREDDGVAEERHANRLRKMGVATYAGFDWAERIARSNDFDLAIVAYWELAEHVVPILRIHSPGTPVVVNSMDVHFLRNARRSFRRSDALDTSFGRTATRELMAYHAADLVIAVSDEERALLGAFLGDDRVMTLPLAESVQRSSVPLEERSGVLFVGNFRHAPNRDAAEFLCAEVVPQLDRELLRDHPVTIVGNWLTEANLAIDDAVPGVNVVGWVPSVRPYLERSRISVVPLLHGAGVKRKVIQSMMAYTPVVTTPVGAEGMDVVQGEHALIAVDSADLATGITRLLTEDDLWHHLAESGSGHVDDHHSLETVRTRFHEIISHVVDQPRRMDDVIGSDGSAVGHLAEAVRDRIQTVTAPGDVVLVASGGEERLVDVGSHQVLHFPQSRFGGWAGYEPADGPAAITHLEAQRDVGARWFVLPSTSFPWRTRFPEFADHLEAHYRRVHEDDQVVMWDLDASWGAERADPPADLTVEIVGTYRTSRTGPPPALPRDLASSTTLRTTQTWRSDDEAPFPALPEASDADYVVAIRDDAVLPSNFLDRLIATQNELGVDRMQPTHTSGPAGGPPITERQRGTVARDVDATTTLPVLSIRRGRGADGPVTLADNVTIGLRRPIDSDAAADPPVVLGVWLASDEGRPVRVERPEPVSPPRISVLIATYERSDLLRQCLESFARQSLDRRDFEVIIVDDGSAVAPTGVTTEFEDRMQIHAIQISHSGRSAAKNHAILLARAPIVLFFDDDDRADPDYLERHLSRHEARPDETIAVLGHTDWAPELEQTPLMRYITDVDRLMFAYERLTDGQELDWRGFWEGRISCKRSLLVRHGLHDQRLNYSIDVEMAWRLAPLGLRVVYDAKARSVMARPIDVDGFCKRTEAKGRAHAVIASLHAQTDIAQRLLPSDSAERWQEGRMSETTMRHRVAELEDAAASDQSVLPRLHKAYRELFRLLHAKGVASTTEDVPTMPTRQSTIAPVVDADPELHHDGSPPDAAEEPLISISIPVWSRSPELAEMARETIDRIWEVAQLPTEVVVVDNGSPFEVPLAARVHRYDENRGVSTGWNTGIRLSRAPVLVVLNSDCRVEPGWDVALHEAVAGGRRIAFPYTDHCDGLGFTRPDQAGTAGWCFMMTTAVHDEIGPFDEWFSPAFCEDTDYWHRAWDLGVELSPVPAAQVVHARRTSSHPRSDLLLQAHRYKYGWKHNVDPDRAPPYYNREIVDFVGEARAPKRRWRDR